MDRYGTGLISIDLCLTPKATKPPETVSPLTRFPGAFSFSALSLTRSRKMILTNME